MINKNHKLTKSNIPFPHVVIENFFDENFYNILEQNFPSEQKFQSIQNKVNRMNYDTTYGDKLYRELVDKNKEYKELHNYIYSNKFINYFLDLFSQNINDEMDKNFMIHNVFNFKKHPEPFEISGIIDKKTHGETNDIKILYPRLDIGMGKENYGVKTGGKGIHIDNPQRLISILFYLGGYKSIDGGDHRIWKVKNDDELEISKIIKPKPNLLIASLQNNVAFHDVYPIKKIDGSRNAFYIAISSSTKIWKDVKEISINKKFNKNRYKKKSLLDKVLSFFN